MFSSPSNTRLGSAEYGELLTINNCMLASDTSGGQEMYSFEQTLCTKTVGPGVTALVQQISGDRNKVAAGLVCEDFVLFDARDDKVEPIWLGRVMSNPEWNGHGVYKNRDNKKFTFDGVGIGIQFIGSLFDVSVTGFGQVHIQAVHM